MLDAAEQLLHNGNAEQVTVESVVRLSGATVGSFYARFGNVEGLFEALHQRYLTSLYESKIFEALNQCTNATVTATRCITIAAPPEDVFP